MAKVQPELPLDVVQLSETAMPIESTSLSQPKSPRQLPKHLVDFKHYVDSKCCYHSVALDSAELADVQPKAAYRCQMKTLMESRDLDWKEEPATWHHETVLFSETLGRAFENTTRPGEPVGDIWDDYAFNIPSSDKKSKDARSLPQCSYLTRCSDCRGKGLVECANYECKGNGKVTCTQCYGKGKVRSGDYVINCHCDYGKMNCPDCKGGGKIGCSNCNRCGGFRHSVTLRVEWYTRITTLYYQNSFLPEKRMEKAQRVLYWANTQSSWSRHSSMDDFLLSLREDEAHENITLKENLTKQYLEKHLKPTSGGSERMRRLISLCDFSPLSSSSTKNCNANHGQLRLSDTELYAFTANDLIDRGIIGKGSYEVVYKMEHEKSGKMMAVRRVYSDQSAEATEILNELNMFMTTANSCPRLIQFYGGFLQEGYCDIFMQLMDTSLDHFYECVYHRLNQFIPENILACVAFTPERLLPIEPTHRVHDDRSAIWSLGIILHELSTRYLPFPTSGNAFELAIEICQGPSLELTIDRLSHHCKEFANTRLNKDEKRRSAYEQLFEHPFVQQAKELLQAQHFVAYFSNMIGLVGKHANTFDQICFRS
ncbi:unnamed protein product [Rotaria magnacalcarata]|uniref:mitogen-activated protein kinase kinase n=1 Tax=Rotaria magnacalcarata TaxID=392030 RepID=A0A814MCI7_9BILA|nr:unnamed protein product [Rotaria magnacalcarata]